MATPAQVPLSFTTTAWAPLVSTNIMPTRLAARARTPQRARLRMDELRGIGYSHSQVALIDHGAEARVVLEQRQARERVLVEDPPARAGLGVAGLVGRARRGIVGSRDAGDGEKRHLRGPVRPRLRELLGLILAQGQDLAVERT